jgi:hypothetical protein
MTTAAKIFTMIFFFGFMALIVTHPAGSAGDMVAGGSVLDNTLAIETGQGQTGGQHGQVSGVGNF